MKRLIALFALLLGALAFAATGAFADGDHGHHGDKSKAAHAHNKGNDKDNDGDNDDNGNNDNNGHHGNGNTKFTFQMANTDNGSCGGNPWATLQETRTYIVRPNNDGSFTLVRFDRGTFTTTGPASPGACETGSEHGTVVLPGIAGKFGGFIVGTVTGGTFNPNAPCGADCSSREGFLHTYFGPTAVYSCDVNSTDCKFAFHYSSSDQRLKFHHWSDSGRGAGTMLQERFEGDIATA
jgi:hypothetical protein